jgi:hypothetical protein
LHSDLYPNSIRNVDRIHYVRRLCWFAILGQVLFVVAWLLAGALEPGYNHARQYISELGAETADNPWIVNSALILFGLTLWALGAALWLALPRRARAAAPALLFGVAGLGFVVAALAPIECETTISELCEMRFDDGDASTASYVHGWGGFIGQIAFLLTPFGLALALRPHRLAGLVLLIGLIGVVIFALFWVGGSGDDQSGSAGLVQRLGFGTIHEWSGLVAIGLLIWANTRPRPLPAGAKGALEPFRFLDAGMDGGGEMTYSPWARVFRFPREFSYRWRVDYEGSAVWLIHNVLRYEDDRLYLDRTMLARPLSDTVMHLSADDMPGGGRTELFPGGLSLRPSWFLSPWWGVPWPVLGQGELMLEDDRALRGRLDFALFGFLPLARMRFELAGARSARPA